MLVVDKSIKSKKYRGARGNEVKKYDIWMAEMREGKGVEQVGTRPVVIIQNDVGNAFSPAVIVAPLTSSMSKTKIPTHVAVKAELNGLSKDSTILTEQIVTLDKSRLKYKISRLDLATRRNLDVALMVSLGLADTIA